MALFQSAFERLNLPEDATDEDVRNAETNLAPTYGLKLEFLPRELKDALDLLQQHRATYAELLYSCKRGLPIRVPADEMSKFIGIVTMADIHRAEDLYLPGVFHVWRPDQPEPAVVVRQRALREAAAAQKQSRRPHLRYWLSRCLLAAGLCGAGFAAYFGYAQFQAAAGERAVQAARTERLELRKKLVADVAAAERELAELAEAGRTLNEAFAAMAGQSIEQMNDAAGRSRELNRTILRHESVREAWDEIQRDRLTSAQHAALEQELAVLKQRLDDDTVSADDEVRSRQLRDRISKRISEVRRAQEDVQHVADTRNADQFETALPSTTRDTP